LFRSELLGESAGCTSTDGLQLCHVHREAGNDDDEGENGQYDPADPGEDEPGPMQTRMGCVGRWRTHPLLDDA
jgi:hypothetical protein